MLYSATFDALPDAGREKVYHRLYDVLSGKDQAKFARLTNADRQGRPGDRKGYEAGSSHLLDRPEVGSALAICGKEEEPTMNGLSRFTKMRMSGRKSSSGLSLLFAAISTVSLQAAAPRAGKPSRTKLAFARCQFRRTGL